MIHNTTTLPTPPERIHNWLDSQLSIARFAGGMTYNGHHYTIAYDEPGQPLVRDDVLAAKAKATKMMKERQRDESQREAAAAQTVLHLPSEDTEGGSHDCPKTIAKNALNTSAKRGKNAKTDTRRMLRRANDVV